MIFLMHFKLETKTLIFFVQHKSFEVQAMSEMMCCFSHAFYFV